MLTAELRMALFQTEKSFQRLSGRRETCLKEGHRDQRTPCFTFTKGDRLVFLEEGDLDDLPDRAPGWDSVTHE